MEHKNSLFGVLEEIEASMNERINSTSEEIIEEAVLSLERILNSRTQLLKESLKKDLSAVIDGLDSHCKDKVHDYVGEENDHKKKSQKGRRKKSKRRKGSQKEEVFEENKNIAGIAMNEASIPTEHCALKNDTNDLEDVMISQPNPLEDFEAELKKLELKQNQFAKSFKERVPDNVGEENDHINSKGVQKEDTFENNNNNIAGVTMNEKSIPTEHCTLKNDTNDLEDVMISQPKNPLEGFEADLKRDQFVKSYREGTSTYNKLSSTYIEKMAIEHSEFTDDECTSNYPQENNFQCVPCYKTFTRKDSLKIHMNHFHSKLKSHR